MQRWIHLGDQILKSRFSAANPLKLSEVFVVVIAAGVFYGTVMGSFGWVAGHRALSDQGWQMFYSATKVPILLMVSTSISLPSFFVINSLFGLRDDFAEVAMAIIAVQAGLALILASLAPITLFYYVGCSPSVAAYQSAILFNALMFGVASVSSQWLLRNYYRPLVARNPQHARMIWLWIGTYAFVGIQCAWTLRPFIGDYRQVSTFLRPDKFGNAYLQIWEMFVDLLF